jgi:hypothetical protein
VRYFERHCGSPAVLCEERVGDVDDQLLQHGRVLPGLDVRVAHDVGDAGVLGLGERAELLPHRRVHVAAVLLEDLELDAPAVGEPRRLGLVHGLQRLERLRLAGVSERADGGSRAHDEALVDVRAAGEGEPHVEAGVAGVHGAVDDGHAALVRAVAVARRRVSSSSGGGLQILGGLHLHELGEAEHEVVLEVEVVGEHVLVAVADDAAVHAELAPANAADEVALPPADVRDGHGLHADEDQQLVERRQVGDEVGEDGPHAGGQLRVDDADAWDAHDAQAGAQRVDPPERHLVLHVEQVLPPRAVVPHVHDEHHQQ